MYTTTSRAIMALLILALLVSCQQLFTTSLGTVLARDSYPDLSDASLEDALSYLADAQGDQDLATALVSPLYTAAFEAVPGSATYDSAATALVEAVVISTGIGQAMTDGLETYLEDGVDALDMDALLEAITVSTSSVTSLQMIAASPPESMTATQAYTAAATLLVAIVQAPDAPALDLDTATAAQFEDADPDLYAAALDLFNHAQSIDTAGSMFGDIFGGLGFLP
ncbi:MAG: hypothetical protein ABIJ86_03070 [Spirochaetota bacterium]